jgi:hypothetical protein
MATPELGLVPAPHRTVFRLFESTLKADETLRRIFKTWRSWEGIPEDRLEVDVSQCPAIRLTAVEGPDARFGPEGFRGDLRVTIEIAVPGTDLDDLMDVYWAVRRAIYPTDQAARQAISKALVDAGSYTGEPVFDQAYYAAATDKDYGFLAGVGSCTIDLNQTVNP